MAILDCFEICVTVNGIALQEFDDPDYDNSHDHPEVVKYIKATPGATFAIRGKTSSGLQFRDEDYYIGATIYLDSTKVANPVVTMEDYRRSNGQKTIYRNAMRTASASGWTAQKFKFGLLSTSRCIGHSVSSLIVPSR